MSRPMAVRRGMFQDSSQPTVRRDTFGSRWLIGPARGSLEKSRPPGGSCPPSGSAPSPAPPQLLSAEDAAQVRAHHGLPPEQADPGADEHVGAVRDLRLEPAA